jgi:ABC-type Fe3+/spermidine/putrescine transport system ATPase subunit
MSGSALKLVQLTKHFGRVKAVDALSLEVGQGEVFTLLGPSGCGKTTTLRLIAGLEEPDDGEIFFGERVVVSARNGIFVPTHKRQLGMVFQSYAIWPHMTVFDNVAYPLRVRHVPGTQIRERVARVLDLVGLVGLAQRPAPQLSGGQQQRVALARALVSEPSMLLLDEPFSNLDAKLREQMRIQLKLLLEHLAITAVFVTHDQVEALSLSDRIAVLNAGHVEQLGPPRELYERPATPFVRDFLGSTVLLRGTLGPDASPQCVAIELEGLPGVALSAPRPPGAGWSAGDRVWVAIRPEDVQLQAPEGDGALSSCLPGTIEAVLFVGNHCECRVRLDNDEGVLLNVSRWTTLREGDAVRLLAPAHSISLWRL